MDGLSDRYPLCSLKTILLLGNVVSAPTCVTYLRSTNTNYFNLNSDYATKVFGFGTFGRVYGTIICFSGLVNFAQYLLDYLTHGPFHGNPIPINIFLATAGLIVGATLVTFVYIAEKRWREEKRAECDEERQRLIPEEAEEEQA